MWSQVCSALAFIGWRVTVDAFATESNRCVARFWSRFGEPGSEAVDALSVPDWRHSPCPHCAGMHREIVYAFPPSSLIRPAIRKATADAARVVLVVPVAVTAPLWSKLVSCSLWPNSDGFLRIRNPQAVLSHASQYAPKLDLKSWRSLRATSPSSTRALTWVSPPRVQARTTIVGARCAGAPRTSATGPG